MDSLQLDTKALVTHLGQDFLIEVVRKQTAISHCQMRKAFTGIIFPCLQTANLALDLRNHTSQLITCLESVLEGIRLGLESAAADSLNCRGPKRQRHHLVGGRLVILDLLETSQKMDPALLRLVVLLVGDGGICDRDRTNFTPLEMSRGKTQCHIVTLVCVVDSVGDSLTSTSDAKTRHPKSSWLRGSWGIDQTNLGSWCLKVTSRCRTMYAGR